MPAVSKAQLRKLFSINPALGKEFADATPNVGALPEHVKAAAHRRLRKQGLANERRHVNDANQHTPFNLPKFETMSGVGHVPNSH